MIGNPVSAGEAETDTWRPRHPIAELLNGDRLRHGKPNSNLKLIEFAAMFSRTQAPSSG